MSDALANVIDARVVQGTSILRASDSDGCTDAVLAGEASWADCVLVAGDSGVLSLVLVGVVRNTLIVHTLVVNAAVSKLIAVAGRLGLRIRLRMIVVVIEDALTVNA